MAFAPVKISRMSLLKAVSLDLKGSSWVSTGCPLTPRADATRLVTIKSGVPRNHVICSAVQESSTPTAVSAETTEPKSEEKQEAKAAAKEPKAEEKTEAKDTPAKAAAKEPTAEEKTEAKDTSAKAAAKEPKAEEKTEAKDTTAKPKPAAKAPVKALPQMMEEDVIPPLRSILETQEDIKELELAFNDNQLVGSFQQNGIPYTFWAFFPDGNLTGPKGFSLSSYGSEVSTVEPFLVDEKKATAKHVVFWVEKRLAAQGIIPVWEK